MQFAGIVSEYNPFHNGHEYHIQETRRQGATHIVAVISGHLVQRGETAVFSKWTRARAAILGGVDLVLELPAVCSCGPAERFARGAVSILSALGLPGALSFGSEAGDISALSSCGEALEAIDGSPELRQYLSQGYSFPNARTLALAQRYGPETAELLQSPNNILAVEYLKALAATSSPLAPMAIRRNGPAHDGRTADGGLASASYIREACRRASVRQIAPFVPQKAYPLYRRDYALGLWSPPGKGLAAAALYHLQTLSRSQLAQLPDMSEGLENKLWKAARQARTMDELFAMVKSKRYPLSRIRRVVFCALLGITAELAGESPPYLRVLAFNERGQELLHGAKKTAKLPVYHSFAKLERDFPVFAEKESLATALFRLSLQNPVADFSEYRDQRSCFVPTEPSVSLFKGDI